jgi:penicillin-binding protein 1A
LPTLGAVIALRTGAPLLRMSRRERHKRRERRRGHPVRRVALMAVVIGVCGAALGALAAVGWVVAVADSAANLTDLKPRAPAPLSQIFASDGTSLGYIHSDTVFSAVSGTRIPTTLKNATVAIEDRRFYQHGALDYQGILRAGIRDLFGGSSSLQGASTLTMQLVDNQYMPSDVRAHHNLKYKILQAKWAEQLQKQHTKSWILDSYLNVVPYGTVGGQTAIGVGAASQIFFNKQVWQLDLAQQALLAGLPQAPSEYNPFTHPALARQRRHDVLDAMVKSRYISPLEAQAADREPLGVQANTTYSVRREPYVFDYVQQQLIQRFGLKTVEQGGLKVYTTIDLKKQQEARSALDSHEGGSGNPAAGLATVDPTNGHILAMASTASYDQTKVDYPVQAFRQPGSAFKVFALMTLIHDYNGDPNQTYYNSHFLAAGWLPQDPNWSVHTAEQTYQGDISVAKATVVSDNTVFAQLAADLGWDKLDATARAMGITSPLDGNPSEVIGGLRIGVTPLEMADAYATLANGGVHIPPTIITKVVFPDGSAVNLSDPAHKRVFTDGEAYTATQVLKGVIQSGTGTAADFGCPAAGKTGTAENMDNAWFVGYTPQLSTGVWVGYPNGNIPMPNGFGGALAAPIWHDFMSVASNGYCSDFPQPNNPFSGTAFFGPHSSTGNSNNGPGRNGNGNGNGGNNGNNSGNATGNYNNPGLYAQPPQGPSTGGTGQAPRTTTGPSTGTGHSFGGGHPGGGGNSNGGSGGRKH